MTDRDLLENAAKAAGYKVKWSVMRGGWADGYECFRHENGLRFDSLTDDGDAMRLAVKLRIFLDEYLRDRFAYLFGAEMVDHAPDKATRRAITRVAAEIGEAMP